MRQVAHRIGIEPAYLSKIERGDVPPPSEKTTVRLAHELGQDPDVFLAMAGKVSGELQEIIRKRPKVLAELIRSTVVEPGAEPQSVNQRSRSVKVHDEVVSKDDPGRRGQIISGPRCRSDGRIFRVRWDDNTISSVPEYSLELAHQESDDPFVLLRKKRFGRIKDLRRNLTFIQLSGKLANVVYGMDATNTEFLAYQYKPVLNFLESPSNGLLIADEVGLGKTIEAGLIWTELRARYDARRLVVVCPAMLRDKWDFELRSKFGIDPVQLNASELANELRRNKNDTPDNKGFICSIQGIRPPTGWRDAKQTNGRIRLATVLDQLTESEPTIDLLIVDEAHYMRNPETRSASLGRMLREVSENVVLLSATPINNREDDLYQLLRLVDPDSFYTRDLFPQVLSANEPLLRARNRVLDPQSSGEEINRCIRDAMCHPLFTDNRQLQGLVLERFDRDFLKEPANRVGIANRIDRINLLRHTINRTRKREVEEWKVVREPRAHFVPLDPDGLERQFYEKVTQSIRRYAVTQGISDGFLLSTPQRQMSSCMYAAAKSWIDKSTLKDVPSLVYEDSGEDETNPDNVRPLIEHIASEVLPGIDIERLKDEDSKFAAFERVLREFLKDNPNEKVIVFSYFKATLHYLESRFSDLRVSVQVLHGSIPENKQDEINRFRDGNTRVLLTSEVSSEGVDLQFCSVIFNYDLPWNPMRIEQRIGRVDRIGQEADKVLIWNLGYADTIDERIYYRLLDKLEIFERALGGMEVVLGETISELTSELMSLELTKEQEERRIDQAVVAVVNVRSQQEELESKAAHLIAYGDYIIERVRAAHEFKRRITELDIKSYVKDYLDHNVKGFVFKEHTSDPMTIDIQLPPNVVSKFDTFVRHARLQGQTRLTDGSTVRCQFRNKIDRFTRHGEIVSQFHPLVRFISEELKGARKFCQLVAVALPKQATPKLRKSTYAFSAKRWTFNGLKTEEELHVRAINVSNSDDILDSDHSWDLLNQAKVEGSDWLSAGNDVDEVEQIIRIFDQCDIQLENDYKIAKRSREDENHDRVAFQIQVASRHRDRLLESQYKVLAGHKEQNRTQLIPMVEGRIRKIKQKFEIQIEGFRNRGEMSSATADVCYGLIRVD